MGQFAGPQRPMHRTRKLLWSHARTERAKCCGATSCMKRRTFPLSHWQSTATQNCRLSLSRAIYSPGMHVVSSKTSTEVSRMYDRHKTLQFFHYFVKNPTKAQLQLIYKLSRSCMFRHYHVILRELVFITSPSYLSISIAAVGNTI